MKITAFINPYCPWSPGVIAFLKEQEIDYEIKDITRNRAAYDDMVKKSGQFSSPCVEIEGEMLADVGREEVEAWFKSKGLCQ